MANALAEKKQEITIRSGRNPVWNSNLRTGAGVHTFTSRVCIIIHASAAQSREMTNPTSTTHHSGSGQFRLYLKHLFSVSFEVALPLTVRKDIASFDSNMQYYSEFVAIHRFRVLQSRGLSGLGQINGGSRNETG